MFLTTCPYNWNVLLPLTLILKMETTCFSKMMVFLYDPTEFQFITPEVGGFIL
jgi:hypothetical protein